MRQFKAFLQHPKMDFLIAYCFSYLCWLELQRTVLWIKETLSDKTFFQITCSFKKVISETSKHRTSSSE